MESIWKIGVIGKTTLQMFGGPLATTVATTIGDRYSEFGMLAVGDERGIINRHAIQFSRGLEVTITNQKRETRLSINSSIGMMSLQSIRRNELPWPLVVGADGNSREPPTTEKCVVLGNKRWWQAVLVHEKAVIDTLWRPTPFNLWKEVIWGTM